MRYRWGATALLVALLGGVPAVQPSAAAEPEWVSVDGDFVVGAAAARSRPEGHGATRLALGDGFTPYEEHESYGRFTVRLRASSGIETLRPYVAQAVREITAASGMSLTLATGTTTAELPEPGEILLQVSSTSPCSGTWSGCGGPRTSMTVAGRAYWTSGQAWFNPTMLSFPDHERQHVVSHELGHTLGLRHHDGEYAGEAQVMHSARFDARSYRAGDRNGLAWLRPDPPPNDHLANAARIGPETSAAGGSLAWATHEPGEWTDAGSAGEHSVWYRWTAPRDGPTEFATTGTSFDTRIAVYVGVSHPELVLVDASPIDGQVSDSAVRFDAQAGTTYSISVDTRSGAVGSFTLHLIFDGPVPNDDFAAATPVHGHGGGVTGSNAGTTLEPDEPLHSTTAAARASAWFRWRAPRSGRVSISTRGSSFDTVLAVYAGPALDSLTQLASGDDDLGAITSRVAFDAVAGTTYSIAVAGYNGSAGTIELFVDTGIDRYAPLPPRRILDSRATTAWGPGETRWIDVAGLGGVPAHGVSGVLLNVTATAPTLGGYLTLWPSRSARPVASNLNFGARQTVANAVQVKVGPDGRIGVFNAAGTTHVIVDVVGYTAPRAANGFEVAAAPARLLDSRTGNGSRAAPWAGGETRAFVVAGRGGVPSAGVTAVVLNVTAVSPTAGGYAAIWPAATPRPGSSSLNFDRGRTVANLVVAGVGPNGAVSLHNAGGATHYVADVLGWYSPSGRLAGTSAPPARVVDSRTGTGTAARAWGPGETRLVAVGGRGGIPPTGATAAVLNLTAVAPTAAGYLSAWSGGAARPNASTVNFPRGANVPNLTVVRLGTGGGTANVFNALGSTHVTADVAGWFFLPPPA